MEREMKKKKKKKNNKKNISFNSMENGHSGAHKRLRD